MILAHPLTDEHVTRLYYYPRTRAVRARWMLEELNIPFELSLVDLARSAHKHDNYLDINPLGKVPALKVSGTVIFESLAICLFLADKFPQSRLAPTHPETVQRAHYYKWMAFSVATLEPALLELSRLRKAKNMGVKPVDLGPALTPFEAAASVIDQTLCGQPYLLGDQFTAADLMNGAMMMSADRSARLGKFLNIKAWTARLAARPAYQRASSEALGGTK